MAVSGALTCAQERILILTPYFLPDEVMLRALQVAALRGVTVEIIIPEKNNLFGFDWAMEPAFPRLLELNQDLQIISAFDLSKVIIVDDGWSSVGSCNWDARSFRLNFECNLECGSERLARKLTEIFEDKKSRSRATTLEDLRQRPTWILLRKSNRQTVLTVSLSPWSDASKRSHLPDRLERATEFSGGRGLPISAPGPVSIRFSRMREDSPLACSRSRSVITDQSLL